MITTATNSGAFCATKQQHVTLYSRSRAVHHATNKAYGHPDARKRSIGVLALDPDRVRDYDGGFGPKPDVKANLEMESILAEMSPEEQTTVRLFQTNSPSVVNISSSTTAVSLFPLSLFQLPQGVGSGFVWDRAGHVVTNAHVIQFADQVKVTLNDQRTYSAKVVGKDREKDVAVLQLDMPKEKMEQLQPLTLGSSSTLMVGQKVYAIGNPFGLDQTLTQGIISGLGRELPSSSIVAPISNVIQTDAAINPGNSGGPLLDSKGRLVGINTAILDPSGSGSFSGVGFAIPIDPVKGMVQQILKYGRVLRPALGLTLASPYILRMRGIQGVLVGEVKPRGPAEMAGVLATRREMFGNITLGDIIVGLAGKKVKQQKDLFAALDECSVGQTVELVVRRNNSERVLAIKLSEREKLTAFE